MNALTDLTELTHALRRFRDERNWAQFHTIKDLLISLNLEAAELLELSQWKSEAALAAFLETESGKKAFSDECADVFLYLLLIADKTGIDLVEAAKNKMQTNAQKYPADKCFGSARKYDKNSN